MKKGPEKLCDMIDHVVSAPSAASVKEYVIMLTCFFLPNLSFIYFPFSYFFQPYV